MKYRSGMTLIEVVGVLTIIGTLLSTSTVIIGQSFKAHRAALDHLRKMHSLEQFVQRWRSDVQACQQVSIDDQLDLTLSDRRRLRYSAKENLVTRIQYLDDIAVGQEVWELPNKCQLTWLLEGGGKNQLLIGELEFNKATVTKSLSEKGSDPLRRGQKANGNDSPPKGQTGQTPFRTGSKNSIELGPLALIARVGIANDTDRLGHDLTTETTVASLGEAQDD